MSLFGYSTVIKILTDLSTQQAQLDYKLDLILKELQNMATNPPVTQAQFDAGLANLQTDENADIVAIQKVITDLVNKIQAGTQVDLTNELTAVNQMLANLNTATTTAQASDPTTTTSAPTGTTPPPATT